jgi:hypothetical protein
MLVAGGVALGGGEELQALRGVVGNKLLHADASSRRSYCCADHVNLDEGGAVEDWLPFCELKIDGLPRRSGVENRRSMSVGGVRLLELEAAQVPVLHLHELLHVQGMRHGLVVQRDGVEIEIRATCGILHRDRDILLHGMRLRALRRSVRGGIADCFLLRLMLTMLGFSPSIAAARGYLGRRRS